MAFFNLEIKRDKTSRVIVIKSQQDERKERWSIEPGGCLERTEMFQQVY